MAKSNKVSVTKLFPSLWQFMLEARDELRKVSWPDRETTIRYTIIVIAASLLVGAVIGGVDYVFTILLERTLV